jgi:hypothetical protein
MKNKVTEISADFDEVTFEEMLASGDAGAPSGGDPSPIEALHFNEPMFVWLTEPPEIKPGIVDVFEIDPFSAKGMRRVYGRSDHFGGGRTFRLDIWKNKNDQLFMRCWSHYSDYFPRSFLITGVNPQALPKVDGKPDLREEWVPQIVRDAYDDWAREEY